MKYKNTFILLIALASGWQYTIAQWSQSFNLRDRTANAVVVINNQTAFVAGGNESGDSIESVFSTYDGDTTWNISLEARAPWLTGIAFSNAGIGLAVGETGTIIRTTDLGYNWVADTLSGNVAQRNYNGVVFAGDSVAFAVGGFPNNDSIQTILRSDDAGLTWTIQRDVLGHWLRAVFFTDVNNGYAVGDSGVVLKTSDGGTNWNVLTLTGNFTTRNYNALYFLNRDTGLIVGGYPANDSIQTILGTTDGGANWNVIMDQLGPMLKSISFADRSQAYVVGNHGIVMKSTDAGLTWNNVSFAASFGDTVDLNAVSFVNTSYGMAVGLGGIQLIYRDSVDNLPLVTTDQATAVSSTAAVINGQVVPNSAAATVWFQYGTTAAMTDTIGTQTLSGSNSQSLSAGLAGLLPNTFYYYRLNATNTGGTIFGNRQQLYTTDCEIPNCDFEVWDTTYYEQPVGWYAVGSITRVPGYNGTSAVRITGNNYTGDAEIVLGTPVSGSGVAGGIPFAARPDSLVFYAKYNIVYPDTASILLLFKKNGVFIDQFTAPVTGSSGGSFVRLSYPITYANGTMPDSLIMGVFNSSAPADTGNANTVITVDDISFTGTNLTVPNWNFEQWDTLMKEQPASWYSDAYGSAFGSTTLLQKSTDRVSGHYAIRLQGAQGNAISLTAGPSSRFESTQNRPVFPIAGKHTSLNFYLKYMPYNGDSLYINLALFYHGVQIANNFIFYIDTTYLAYTPVAIPIIYSDTTFIPDSAFLSFQVGSLRGSDTSVAYIDNLSFDGFKPIINPSAIKNETTTDIFDIFPSPASSIIHINTASVEGKTLQLYNLQGGLLFIDHFNGSNYDLMVGNLPEAVYLVRMTDSNGFQSKLITVIR